MKGETGKLYSLEKVSTHSTKYLLVPTSKKYIKRIKSRYKNSPHNIKKLYVLVNIFQPAAIFTFYNIRYVLLMICADKYNMKMSDYTNEYNFSKNDFLYKLLVFFPLHI